MEENKGKSKDCIDKGESTAYSPSYPMGLENEQNKTKDPITFH